MIFGPWANITPSGFKRIYDLCDLFNAKFNTPPVVTPEPVKIEELKLPKLVELKLKTKEEK